MKNNETNQKPKMDKRKFAIRTMCFILAVLFIVSSFTIALTFILQACGA